MREPGGVGGLTGSGGDEGAGSHGGAAGSQDRGGVWASEAEGGVEGSSRLNANRAGDGQTSGEPTPQMVSWGWAERLTKSSEDGVEKGNRSLKGGGRGRLGGIFCQSDSSDEGWVKSISESKSINSPESSVSSPSAVAPWAGLSIAPAISTAVSTVACAVSSRSWSDTWGSGSGAIVSPVALMAMAQRPWQALALCLRWALAAPRRRVEVDWALGPEWGWCHHPRCPQKLSQITSFLKESFSHFQDQLKKMYGIN